MKWITREKPKIDRIACPWLIKKYIDSDAEFIFVPFDAVIQQAEAIGAIPFDVPNVELSHQLGLCTFDCLIEKYNIDDEAVHTMAVIVRGADTDRHDIAPQSAGLWAIASGMAHNIQDDHELLKQGMVIYDGLYSWAKYLQSVKHFQNPFENLLVDVFQKVFHPATKSNRKTPVWAKELKDIIQDQIDTNLTLSLKEISKELDVNPAYLSREFSKYFENLSFGEYIRKLRIEKAIELLSSTNHSLTEIAYLTGFSDQSHFTRIFKKYTGENPSVFKKNITKSKFDTKS
ncbi:chromate resistance protein [Arcicella aquatica]|uniref:Chromate resistance protein n=1 Tax=Arcicella aquatica TaxID=217141 RepID=A0ABU5QKB9_9BACT|nr:chromate resistance protein ChrB domain-containing protein [Arcicella aquatica]MEA5257375.1 chromate resistance protein [Arcicella aquatica]